ncbi:FadR/GntR family transcriptional regulator [Frigidibacter albus]
MSSFQQLSRTEHLPKRIAEEIGRGIAEGRFAAGDKLPTEHVLAQTFGVSRSVVREAIAELRNEGMVETRQGVGAFVTDPQRRATIWVEQARLADPVSLRNFFQLRLPLEVEAARLAARHRTPTEIVALDLALDGMVQARDWLDEGVKADLAFHRALAAATQNEFYVIFLGFIAEKTSTTINTLFPREMGAEIVQVTIGEHAAIHSAVVAGDAARAGGAMHRHLINSAARLGIALEAG